MKRPAEQVGGGSVKRAREDARAVRSIVSIDDPIVRRVRFVAQAVNGVLEEYTIDLERQEQTAEKILEVRCTNTTKQ